MSENKTIIKNLNGHALADQEARAAAVQNANRIDSLYKEIADLKSEDVVTINFFEGNEFNWFYDWSTFSGWRTEWKVDKSIDLDSMTFRIKARDTAITQVRCRVALGACADDSVVFDTTLDVDIPADTDKIIRCELPSIAVREGRTVYVAVDANQLATIYCSTVNYGNPSYNLKFGYVASGNMNAPMDGINKGITHKMWLVVTARPSLKSNVTLILPERYALVCGDTFELFYKGVIFAANPNLYDIEINCGKGEAYSKRFIYTPAAEDVGERALKVSIYDGERKLLDTASVTLDVAAKASSPERQINVLTVGDSLTVSGAWPAEVYRRLTSSGGTPAADGLANINFIGTCNKDDVGYEGHSGWKFENYLAEADANPFYDVTSAKVDFMTYAQRLGVSTIDYVYVLLGWNSAYSDEAAYKPQVRTFINNVLAAFPDCKIVLIGLQIPSRDGLGTSYGATGVYSKYYTLLEHVRNIETWYADVAAEYSGKVSTINLSGQFDTDNNMPTAERPVNARNAKIETYQNNGVHPNISGYMQIADAVYRDLTHKLQG